MSAPGQSYSLELADAILSEMADGKSLKAICQQPGMPSRMSVWRWLRDHEDFAARYDVAQRDRAQAFVDDLSAISDDPSLDPNDKRIRVDTRKWLASKILPKLYGDKVALTDSDGGPIAITWTGTLGSS